MTDKEKIAEVQVHLARLATLMERMNEVYQKLIKLVADISSLLET